ncbi:hypothetical protein EBR44_14750, partial [bacterium]|nr:hypothetical protein [bacterium]
RGRARAHPPSSRAQHVAFFGGVGVDRGVGVDGVVCGFGAPLRRWLRNELRSMVDETLDPVSLTRRGFFDPRAVRSLITQDRTGAVDGSYTIFALMCVELWCRRFIDL